MSRSPEDRLITVIVVLASAVAITAVYLFQHPIIVVIHDVK